MFLPSELLDPGAACDFRDSKVACRGKSEERSGCPALAAMMHPACFWRFDDSSDGGCSAGGGARAYQPGVQGAVAESGHRDARVGAPGSQVEANNLSRIADDGITGLSIPALTRVHFTSFPMPSECHTVVMQAPALEVNPCLALRSAAHHKRYQRSVAG